MSLRDQLREETRAEHEALHEHGLLKPLLSADLTFHNYILVLSAFHAFYSHAENISKSQRLTFQWESPVLDWLKKEGELLELKNIKPQEKKNMFKTGCFSEYVGYLYFKQGSTLGGRLIGKSLESSLGIRGGENGFFYHGFGDKTGQNWKAFEAFLQTHENNINSKTAIEAAKACFTTLHDYFNQYETSKELVSA